MAPGLFLRSRRWNVTSHCYEAIRSGHGPHSRRTIPGSTGVLTRRLMGLMSVLITAHCAAHHSVAMFDTTKPVTLHGTVKELQWVNPHCFLQMLTPTGDALTEWSIELQSPSTMYRLGWRPGTLLPGDKVTVVIAPTKYGMHGGTLMSAIDVNGKALQTAKVRQ
jgi:hypothetical protein